MELTTNFDCVLQSCKTGIRKPSVEILNLVEGKKSSKNILFDVDTVFLDNAKQIGFVAINSSDIATAVKELSVQTGTEIKKDESLFPMPCHPDEVPHAYAEVRPGVTLHYVDIGTGPVVMLFHGFPEMWYTWRYQMSALCKAGYRVIAMDQRGYGDSSHIEEITTYTQKELCKDAIPTCIIIGHDWGGTLVWSLAVKHPDRIKAVGSVHTPFFTKEGLAEIQKNMHKFNYQLYFHKPGVAEKELEANLTKTINFFFFGGNSEEGFGDVTKRGCLMGPEVPDDIRSPLLTDYDVSYYVKQFTKSGFRGPLNYYRNQVEDGKWRMETPTRKITCPALMVTTDLDPILPPSYTKGMEKVISNLTMVYLTGSGHWALFEKPGDVSKALIGWLGKIAREE